MTRLTNQTNPIDPCNRLAKTYPIQTIVRGFMCRFFFEGSLVVGPTVGHCVIWVLHLRFDYHAETFRPRIMISLQFPSAPALESNIATIPLVTSWRPLAVLVVLLATVALWARRQWRRVRQSRRNQTRLGQGFTHKYIASLHLCYIWYNHERLARSRKCNLGLRKYS